MAITVNLTSNGATTSQTVASGTSISVSPSDQIQIEVNGVVIDPTTVDTDVTPPDVTITLPDGQQITLLNFVDLQGGTGGGLTDAGGEVTVASTLDALINPAGGQPAPDDGGDEDGDGNLSTFNQADPFEFAEFGSGAGGTGPDGPVAPDGVIEDGEPFELIIALPAPPGEPPVVIVVPLVPTPVPPPVVDTPGPDTPGPDTPVVDETPVVPVVPALTSMLINEIVLGGGSTEDPAILEIREATGAPQGTAGGLLTFAGPDTLGGDPPVVVALPAVIVPANGKLVIREDGTFEVFDSTGTSVAAGTFATPPWSLGTNTTEPIGVNLSLADGTEVDTFQANGVEFLTGGWTSNTAGTAAIPAPFDELFDLDGFSGFSGDIDTVLDRLNLELPVVDAIEGVTPVHPEVDVSEINNRVFARVFGSEDGTPIDTDSEADWTTSNSPTPGSDNAAPDDINPQDETSPDDFDPRQNDGLNPGDAGQTVLVGATEIFLGSRGPDFVFGTEPSLSKDALVGGDDILAGGDHNDFLYGNTGDDLLSGGVVTETLIGGSGGADILVDFDPTLNGEVFFQSQLSPTSDVLVGGNGQDLLLTRGPAEEPIMEGGEDSGTAFLIVESVSEGKTLDLLVGDNIGLLVRDGEFTDLGGSAGGVSLFTGLENGDRDVIIAGDYSDVIFGDNLGIPTDVLDFNTNGGSLLDLVVGGLNDGANRLRPTLNELQEDLGWRHHSNSYGAADNIDAGGGDDEVFGQGGNDEIIGGAGSDLVFGGAGDDWIQLGPVGGLSDPSTDFELGVGDDLAVEGSGLTMNPLTGPTEPPMPEVTGGNDVIIGHDQDTSSTVGDFLIGDGIISVASFDMQMALVETSDIYIGGPGGPAIAGGDDLIIGGSGTDNIFGDGLVAVSDFSSARSLEPLFSSGTALIGGNDTLYGGSDEDVIYGEGNRFTDFFDPSDDGWSGLGDGRMVLSGRYDGDDTIYGGGDGLLYGDTVYGNGGEDTLFGDDGDDAGTSSVGDTVYGNAGDDQIYGEEGSDTLYGDDGFNRFFDPFLTFSVSATMVEGHDGFSYNDTIYGGDVDGDKIYGDQGNDILYGGNETSGNGDTVYGNVGDDLVYGGEGEDTLYGDEPAEFTPAIVAVSTTNGVVDASYNDTLYGDQDADTIYGNRGDDLIVQRIKDNDPGEVDIVYGDDGQGDLTNDDTYKLINDSGTAVAVTVRPFGPEVNGTQQVEVLNGTDRIAILDEVADIEFVSGDPGDTFTVTGNFDNTDVTATTISMSGGGGNDTLDASGLESPHRIVATGDDGNDTLEGGAGNDTLEGGNDTDTLYGDPEALADVSLVYGLSDDDLSGDAGADTLYGDIGESLTDSSVLANGGADTLDGGTGDDLLYGDSGNDLIADPAYGGITGGDDTLFGGGNDDVAYGDAGRNLDGGEGNAEGGNDLLYGGEGNNQLFGDAGLDLISSDGGSVKGVDFVSGGNDQLTAGGGNDVLYGDAGRDIAIDIFGAAYGGADTLEGGGGNDSLYGDAGNDLFDGGDGRVYGGADLIYGGQGDDDIFGDAGGNMVGGNAQGGADTIYGEGGGDFIIGDAGGTIFGGTGGDDVIYGGDDVGGFALIAGDATQLEDGAQGGDDLIYGGSNVLGDTNAGISGGAAGGNDEIHGSDQSDIIDGDSGASILLSSYGGDDLVYGGGGNDQITGDAGVGGSGGIQFSSFAGDDTLFGDDGDDQIYGDTRGIIDDTSEGGDDILSGGIGNDTLYGDSGGNDNLMGGNDTLVGETGTDTLYGGSGSDLLVIGGDGNTDLALADILADYADGTDTIGLSGGLMFDDLTFTADGLNTVIGVDGSTEILAVVLDTAPGVFDVGDFVAFP